MRLILLRNKTISKCRMHTINVRQMTTTKLDRKYKTAECKFKEDRNRFRWEADETEVPEADAGYKSGVGSAHTQGDSSSRHSSSPLA